MAKYIDTEPYLLLTGAKNDVIDIHSSLVNDMFSVEEKSHKICFNATRAAEKALKGYIRFIDDKTDVKYSHMDTLLNIVTNNNTLICYKHKTIDQNKRSTFENMKLEHISHYGKYLSKYTKTTSAGKHFVLCRNVGNNIKELFFVDRDFNQKQAEYFIKDWDKNNNQKNNLKK